MINLLPLDQRRQLRAARTNVLLFRYSIGLVFVAVALGLSVGAGYFLLTNEMKSADTTIASNQSRVGNLSAVQAQADEYRKNLADAKTLLDSEIQYSKIYLELAHIMPEGTALDTLTLDPSKIGAPLTLPVKIKGEQQASSLLTAFRGSTLFNNSASYGALTANAGSDSATYPYVITINVTINKGAIQ